MQDDELQAMIGPGQFVRVEVAEGKAYTYRAYETPPLRKGEKVVCPANQVQAEAFYGTVIRLLDGPDPGYDGPYKVLLGRAS